MHGSRESDGRGPGGSRLAVLAYVAAWLAGAAALVGVLLAVLDDGRSGAVTLPPVEETELAKAARDAGCELHRTRRGQELNPPVDGTAAPTPAPAGVYEKAPSSPSLVAALRDGVVVIQFRRLDGGAVELLRTMQQAVPDGTIVTPNDTGMPFAVAVTAYRRLLGCRQLNETAIDAIQLFRGRFVGSGPDV